MLRQGLSFSALLLTLIVGAASAQILNSERIEQTFGSYGILAFPGDKRLRVSFLYSSHGDRDVWRTVAMLRYPSEVDPAFADEHAAILAGGSIGQVFKAAGWDVLKHNVEIRMFPAHPGVAHYMEIDANTPLAMHSYRLDISRAGETFEYVTIIEMHHPDYLTMPDLREIYGSVPAPSYGEMWRNQEVLMDGLMMIDRLTHCRPCTISISNLVPAAP
jgi:hypothetical protein